MAEKIVFENGSISKFVRLVTLTLDRVILHTVVHHSSTSTYKPNFTKIEKKLFVDGRTYVHTDRWMDGRAHDRWLITDEWMDGHLRPTLVTTVVTAAAAAVGGCRIGYSSRSNNYNINNLMHHVPCKIIMN